MEFKDFSRLCEPWKINKTDSFKYAGRTPLRTERDCLELRFSGYLTGDVHGSLGMSGLLVLGGEEASGSEVAKGMEIAMGAASSTSLSTVSAAGSLSRTRTWSWCRRMTDPSSNWIRADTGPVLSTTVPGIHVFL